MIIQLQEMLEITRKNSNQAKKIRERREWLRMAAYITQCTNTLLRDLNLDELKKRMERIENLQRIQDEEKAELSSRSSYTAVNAPWARSSKKIANQNTLPEKKPLPEISGETSDRDNPASLDPED